MAYSNLLQIQIIIYKYLFFMFFLLRYMKMYKYYFYLMVNLILNYKNNR